MEWEFLENKVNEIKKELSDRKKWRTALRNEYCKVRVQKNDVAKHHIIKMITTANVMINHYEMILEEYKKMLKECKEIK